MNINRFQCLCKVVSFTTRSNGKIRCFEYLFLFMFLEFKMFFFFENSDVCNCYFGKEGLLSIFIFPYGD